MQPVFLAGDGDDGSVLPMVRASPIERTCSESLGLHTEKCLFGEREGTIATVLLGDGSVGLI